MENDSHKWIRKADWEARKRFEKKLQEYTSLLEESLLQKIIGKNNE